MFSSFDSTQTPAVKWWNFSKSIASNGAERIALEDDCAPIQYFATGGSSSTIVLYLPTNPPQGKQITIRNDKYSDVNTATNQTITIYDTSNSNNSILSILGSSSSIVLTYVQWGSTSCWSTMGIAPPSSSVSGATVSGYNNCALSGASTVGGGAGNNSGFNGDSCTIGGGSGNTAQGGKGTIGGGDRNSVGSGGYNACTVSGGDRNSASNNYAAVGGGQFNGASGANSTVGGGNSNSASASYATVAGGQSGTASGSNAAIGGGISNTASGAFSTVVGGSYGSTRSISGLCAIPAGNSPIVSTAGITQTTILNLGVVTTNATATVLRSNTAAATTTNQLILAANAASTFQGQVTALARFVLTTTAAVGAAGTATLTFAIQTAAPFYVGQTIVVAGVTPTGYNGTYVVTACTTTTVSYANATTAAQTIAGTITGTSYTSAWTFTGAIMRSGTAATSTRLIGTPVISSVAQDADAASWVLALTADTTNGGLAVTVTGNTSISIRWMCTLITNEVTY